MASPDPETLARRLGEANRDGEHLWIIAAAWHAINPGNPHRLLDAENLLSINGPGCWKCELPWSPEIDGTPCTGEVPDGDE